MGCAVELTEQVTAVRSFNRFYTGVIGVLREGLLDTPYTLTEARVLFELARHGTVEVVDLRRALGLDAGYLSRILSRFTADGLVTRSRSADDGRRQLVALTDAGRAAFATLDERSAAETAALLARLDERDRRRLLGAMATVEHLLGGPGPAGGTGPAPIGPPAGPGPAGRPGPVPACLVVLRAPLPGDLGWMVQRHGALYAHEYGWDETFEGLVARIAADFAAGHDPRREAAWIAEVDGEPGGSIMCVRDDDTTARLRVLLVEPAARGMGIGGRLVEECLRFARRAGYRRITLLTYDALADARRLYQRAGFTLAGQRPVTAYGHGLVEQSWSRPL